jgi:hypothetical protein
MIKGILVAMVLPMGLIVAICMNASGEGIYDVGPTKNAVYVAGEVCTINMQLDRDIQTMETEFKECLRIHKTYTSK